MSAMLIWALEHDYIDGALTSYLEGDGGDWKAIPGVATTKDEVLASPVAATPTRPTPWP